VVQAEKCKKIVKTACAPFYVTCQLSLDRDSCCGPRFSEPPSPSHDKCLPEIAQSIETDVVR